MDPELKQLYNDTFPEDAPRQRGIIDNARLGYGHLTQVPVDLMYRARLDKLHPQGAEAIENTWRHVGDAVAGQKLSDGATGDPMNSLLWSIREMIRNRSDDDGVRR